MNWAKKVNIDNAYPSINSAFPNASNGKKTIGKRTNPIEKTKFLPNNLEIWNADKINPMGIIK